MDQWLALLAWVAAGLFAVLYWKGMPGVFHLRLAVACIQGAVFEGRLRKIDDHVIMTERVMLCDMDVNLHQNNSIYNLVADISRYHWISRLVSGNVARLASVKIANGGVSMYFLKEIGFLQRYSVATYCMGMDQKWWCVASSRSNSWQLAAQRSPAHATLRSYMRVEFFRTRPRAHHHRVVLAVGVCRVVFKERNGKTIAPVDFFRSLGYTVDEHLIMHGVGESKTRLLGHLYEPLPAAQVGR